MSVKKIVYESEKLAKLRQELKELDAKELDYLAEFIEKEKEDRKREVYEEWLDCLDGLITRIVH